MAHMHCFRVGSADFNYMGDENTKKPFENFAKLIHDLVIRKGILLNVADFLVAIYCGYVKFS